MLLRDQKFSFSTNRLDVFFQIHQLCQQNVQPIDKA